MVGSLRLCKIRVRTVADRIFCSSPFAVTNAFCRVVAIHEEMLPVTKTKRLREHK